MKCTRKSIKHFRYTSVKKKRLNKNKKYLLNHFNLYHNK
ncbi:hypothetical protein BCAH1134_C0585 (plasmid) [Bacillus cereus AH1134]|nr:hypothetical protein BCAH1134_C0585 [Bacillus cereus AH1134]